ncbi:alpha/beta hydrolase [Lampropedia cohaerens]|uniref:alpha/beta hydrolase n=1 Tax=Lampropedia cohaerens TaxID=1610491 RepID=UPI00069B7DFC|nr:alpha/beta hydrolase-fold protein [Lampropedia cohaerens]
MTAQHEPQRCAPFGRRQALLGLAAICTGAMAQTPSSHSQPTNSATPGTTAAQRYAGGPPEVIDDARVMHFDLHSSQHTGPAWRIHLAQPHAAAAQDCTVLYLLDGNATFPMAWHALERLRQGTGTAAAAAARTALVGIGYPANVRFDVERRFFDYTPATDVMASNTRAGLRTGGQDLFLDFLERDLRPAVATRLPCAATQQGFYGHSLGGLLTLYALYTRPYLFDTWIAADPSLWWNGGSILRQEAAFLATLALAGGRIGHPKRVLIERSAPRPDRARAQEASGHEPSLRPGTGRHSVPQTEARDCAARLAQVVGFEVYFRQFAKASHPAMMAPSVDDALHCLLGVPLPQLEKL